jgi:hypothetical protein
MAPGAAGSGTADGRSGTWLLAAAARLGHTSPSSVPTITIGLAFPIEIHRRGDLIVPASGPLGQPVELHGSGGRQASSSVGMT